MSNVQLTIGGRGFTIACADGEEAHITRLGEMIDAMVSEGGLRTQNEPRMLLYASLMLADQLHEAFRRLDAQPALDPSAAQRLDQIAARLETLAAQMEHAAP